MRPAPPAHPRYASGCMVCRRTNLLSQVQSAARLLTKTPSRDHITPVLHQLHWLPVQRRVELKIACLAHQSITSTAPTYLSADIQLVSEHGRRHLRSSSYRTLAVPRTRTALWRVVTLDYCALYKYPYLLTYDDRANASLASDRHGAKRNGGF